MPIKPFPYGISNYKTIISEGYAYVDKTMYIRSLEQIGVHNLFLRPRRFGKTLFTSMLRYYYDINEKDNFNDLFSHLNIGKNPTKKKNAYYVLKFNFSGIRTDSDEILLRGFTRSVHETLLTFCAAYNLDITLKMDSPEEQLLQVLNQFQRIRDGKIYVIIDEYDHFANELLSFNPHLFKDSGTEDGFVRKWYEVLKNATETVVERIFITGVSPITLDSLTSGFNISDNLSMLSPFNGMIGFTKTEVEKLIEETITEKLPINLMDTLTEYYNGYLFSKDATERIFNSDMVLYYLKHYQQLHKPPEQLLDRNAVSDYGKLEKLITFQTPEQNLEILKEVVFDGYTTANLIESFTIGEAFTAEHFKSLLFYLGLLTIKEPDLGSVRLQIPNSVMDGLYFEFLMKIVVKEADYTPDTKFITEAIRELAYNNSCERLTDLIEGLLHSFSNRDYRGFDEKYIKVAMAVYAGISNLYLIKSEYEVEDGYIDLIFFPRDTSSGLDIILFELKYIQKGKATEERIEDTLSDAVEQLTRYSSAAEFKGKKITCWAIVFAGEMCVERVKVE